MQFQKEIGYGIETLPCPVDYLWDSITEKNMSSTSKLNFKDYFEPHESPSLL